MKKCVGGGVVYGAEVCVSQSSGDVKEGGDGGRSQGSYFLRKDTLSIAFVFIAFHSINIFSTFILTN